MSLRTPVEVSDWVVKTTLGLRIHRGEGLVDAVRVDLLAPLEGDVLEVGPEGLAELGPALAELAAGGDERGLAGAGQVGDRRLRARPSRSRRSRGRRCSVRKTSGSRSRQRS